MCGIGGYTGQTRPELNARILELLRNRGPDGEAVLERKGAVLCHTRLAIVDLSPTGDQPMVRVNGRLAVTYNGEIYNYQPLRASIEQAGFSCLGHSDTELLPLGFAAYGTDFFRQLNGMFAFALHDASDDSLYLARDHFGIKPLYYAEVASGLVFSSSARAVAAHPEVDDGLSLDAVRDYLQFRYVPDGQPFYRGVKQFPAGHWARWHQGRLKIEPFWQPARRRPDESWQVSEWVSELHRLLELSVTEQLRSDVPVGMLLSGGIDSSAVMHFAARRSAEAPMAFTFSIGDRADETAAAHAVASRYGADQVVARLDGSHPLRQLPDAIACMDTPVGDAIILPTYTLCREARRQRKVVLTGEGADELFGGYVHVPPLRALDRLAPVAPVVRMLAPALRYVPIPLLDRFFHYEASLGENGREKVARLLGAAGRPGDAFRLATSIIDDSEISQATTFTAPIINGVDHDLSLSGLMLQGVTDWLPNQILNKMDQLSMAHGLEARVPYLDPRIYDCLARMPDSLVLSRSDNKVLLREVLKQEGVQHFARRKIAFHLPLEQLYRDETLTLAKDWLSDSIVQKYGLLRSSFVAHCLREFAAGDFIASKRLVVMMGLHMWLEGRHSMSV
jgi:asparagine synthase (glutamine-hydrolysing)